MSFEVCSKEDFLGNARVAFLTNTLGPHTLPLCECIGASIPNFRVFTSADEDDSHGFPRVRGNVKVTLLKSFNKLRIWRRIYGNWQMGELHIPYNTYHALRKFSPDIILANQLGLRTTLAVLFGMRHPKTKVILCATLSDHSEKQRSWPRRLLRKWLMKHFQGAFINGKESETYLRRLGFQGPTFTVPYVIRADKFLTETYEPRPNHFRLLYAGMLIPQKGILPFTRVLARWCADHPRTRVSFTLVGDGNEAGKLGNLVTSPNLEIRRLPRMSQDQLAEQYWAADMLAFPTLGDEWGVVVNEAMIAGRPVLGSTYSQAVTELVVQDESGWLFDPHQPASIYSALDRALSCDVERLKAMSGKARQAVRHLTPEQVAATALEGMYRVYNGVTVTG